MTTDGSSPFDDVSSGRHSKPAQVNYPAHGADPARSDSPAPADNSTTQPLDAISRRRRHPPIDPPFVTQVGQVPPVRPPDPISPFIRPPWARRRRREWPILIIALIFAAVVMVVCCLAGFAAYTTYNQRID